MYTYRPKIDHQFKQVKILQTPLTLSLSLSHTHTQTHISTIPLFLHTFREEDDNGDFGRNSRIGTRGPNSNALNNNRKDDERVDETKEKWVKYYSSFHQILLVGDGDFSFSLCLALSFGSASNIVASSFDSYDVVTKKYKNAKSNLEKLGKLGAYCLHGVDATKMKLHTDLQMRKFDRIIYNFPHAGFHGKEDHPRLIKMHRTLVQGFFRNASGMLRAYGEIHVNHKTTAPFSHWNIEELANQYSLALTECVDFKIKDYPGYNNKRGDGAKCDEPFHLGQCSTFKFIFSPIAKKTSQSKNLSSPYNSPYQLQMIQTPVPQQPPGNPFTYMNAGTPYSNLHQPHLIQTPARQQPPGNTCTYMNPGSPYSNLHLLQTTQTPVRQQQPRGNPLTYMNSGSLYSNLHQHQLIQTPVPQQPPRNSFPYMNCTHGPVGSPDVNGSRRNECRRIFSEYFNHAMVTFGNTDYDVRYSVEESLRLGFQRYTAEHPGRPWNKYIQLLEELRHLSNSRSVFLRNMLLEDDQELLARRIFGRDI